MDDSPPARRRSILGIHDTYRNRWHAAGYPRPLAIVRKETVMMNLFAVLTNTGFHLAGWRHPSAWTDTMMNLEQYQIGRASCRERVCQYASISVVAVSLKTKNRPYLKGHECQTTQQKQPSNKR